MSKDDGGPAFPITGESVHSHMRPDGLAVYKLTMQGGMTLRDWFASQALTGIQKWDAIINGKNAQFSQYGAPQQIAQTAYIIADAMLAARAK